MSRGDQVFELIGPATIGYPVPISLRQAVGTIQCPRCHLSESFWKLDIVTQYDMTCPNCGTKIESTFQPRRAWVKIQTKKAVKIPGAQSCRFCHTVHIIAPVPFFWSADLQCCSKAVSEFSGVPQNLEKEDAVLFRESLLAAIEI